MVDMWDFPEYSDDVPYDGSCCINGQYSVHTRVEKLRPFAVKGVPKDVIQHFFENEVSLTPSRKLSVKRWREVLSAMLDKKASTADLQLLMDAAEENQVPRSEFYVQNMLRKQSENPNVV